MKRVRVAVVGIVVVLAMLATGPVALAGEWIPGKQSHTPAPGVAMSNCVYNGQDDDDLEDDEIWAQTPAGGRVQSGGQLIAAGLAPPGIQGTACNGHLNPLNP